MWIYFPSWLALIMASMMMISGILDFIKWILDRKIKRLRKPRERRTE